MRQTLLALMLSAGIVQGWAQGIYYERWVDNNRVDHQFGWLQKGQQTITVDVSGVPSAGLHFLNILPYTEDGEPGMWSQIAFLMPEGWPGTSQAVTMEYWISDNLGTLIRKAYTKGEQQFSIDISNMSYGLHFINYRTFNERGEPGAWSKQAFYMSNHAFDREAVGYQYWIDNGEKKFEKGYTPGEIPIVVSTNGLSLGMHTFNYRLCYSDNPSDASAQFSNTISTTFEVGLLGDANGDNRVNAADLVEMVNAKNGHPSAKFKKNNVDFNGDGQIDYDITEVIKIILAPK